MIPEPLPGMAAEPGAGDAPDAAVRPGRGSVFRRRAYWILAGAAAVALHLLLGRDSAFVETFYSRGVFVGLRWIWDYTLGLSPLPLLFVFWLAAAAYLTIKVLRYHSRPRPRPRPSWPRRTGRAALALAAFAGALVFFFYVLWGFNYDRVRLEKRLGLETPGLGAAELVAEAAWAAGAAAESRAAIPDASASVLGARMLPARLESDLRRALSKVLTDLGYPAPGRVRVRVFRPGGWMMRFSSSGIYIPFFGEGYAAGGILPSEKPFTMAHEMAHGFGLTDEGDANFLAFLACDASGDPFIRYSGYLSYWGYVSAELARAAPAEFRAVWTTLPPGMKADIQAERDNWNRYLGALTKISNRVYERYLRSQGVWEGMLSYSRFVNLVAAWKKSKGGRN